MSTRAAPSGPSTRTPSGANRSDGRRRQVPSSISSRRSAGAGSGSQVGACSPRRADTRTASPAGPVWPCRPRPRRAGVVDRSATAIRLRSSPRRMLAPVEARAARRLGTASASAGRGTARRGASGASTLAARRTSAAEGPPGTSGLSRSTWSSMAWAARGRMSCSSRPAGPPSASTRPGVGRMRASTRSTPGPSGRTVTVGPSLSSATRNDGARCIPRSSSAAGGKATVAVSPPAIAPGATATSTGSRASGPAVRPSTRSRTAGVGPQPGVDRDGHRAEAGGQRHPAGRGGHRSRQPGDLPQSHDGRGKVGLVQDGEAVAAGQRPDGGGVGGEAGVAGPAVGANRVGDGQERVGRRRARLGQPGL